MANKKYIGIDIGGTKVYGIVFQNGEIIEELRQKTPTNNWEEFLTNFVTSLKKDHNILGIGIAVAGALDETKSFVEKTPNIKNIIGVNFKKLLEDKFKIETKLENDANCFAWGEYLYGNGKGMKTVAVITLGTGLGTGLILDNKLFSGSFGSAPEGGHNIVRAGGVKCRCGAKGCWEQYASSQFFLRQMGNNPATVFQKAKDGNKQALKLWKFYGYWVGIGLATIGNMFEPEGIVIGGSIVRAWDFFAKDMENTFRKTVFSPIASKKIKILRAKLGIKAAAIGAARLF